MTILITVCLWIKHVYCYKLFWKHMYYMYSEVANSWSCRTVSLIFGKVVQFLFQTLYILKVQFMSYFIVISFFKINSLELYLQRYFNKAWLPYFRIIFAISRSRDFKVSVISWNHFGEQFLWICSIEKILPFKKNI